MLTSIAPQRVYLDKQASMMTQASATAQSHTEQAPDAREFPPDLAQKFHAHPLIFCISSGRSGTAYLAHLLGTAEHVTSTHEPLPQMIGPYLQLVSSQPYELTLEQRRVKSIAIQNALLPLPKGQIYCETSNMFIKTFFDVVLTDFRHDQLTVITLRRDLARVLKSFVECDFFSPRKPERIWMSSPNSATAAIRCIGADRDLDQYDLCIGYLIDIEARAQRFRRAYPAIRNVEVRLEALADYQGVEQTFQQLGLRPTTGTRQAHRDRVNLMEKVKRAANQVVDLAYCQRRIEQYLEKAAALGIELPPTLAL